MCIPMATPTCPEPVRAVLLCRPAGGCVYYSRQVTGDGWLDPQVLQMVPEAAECGVGVAVEGAATDAVEGPAEPLKDGLPLPVCFPAVRAVIGVAVEFDGLAAATALDH